MSIKHKHPNSTNPTSKPDSTPKPTPSQDKTKSAKKDKSSKKKKKELKGHHKSTKRNEKLNPPCPNQSHNR